MKIVTTTNELAKICQEMSQHSYVTVDTEFLRETTFWPQLCLVQMACPNDACIIDVLAKGIDLDPFFKLMADESTVKVFHAARQDIEIIHKLGGLIPHPVFDTQVAAMVCGYGDSIAYDQLVYKICGKQVDKSSRFTDWRKRPLSEKQLNYALADVTHLRDVYQSIKANLKEQERSHWLLEEMEVLTSVSTYEQLPQNAWKRLKMRARKPRELAMLKLIAEWREETAQANDVPRGRVVKDDAIYELCSQQPKSIQELSNLRSMQRGFDKNRFGENVLEVIRNGLEIPNDQLPKLPRQRHSPEGSQAATEMLKVLLKVTAESHGVAAKVIATIDDLEKIACDDNANVDALKGWRRELFGERAIKLKNGQMAIGFQNNAIRIFDLPGSQEQALNAAE